MLLAQLLQAQAVRVRQLPKWQSGPASSSALLKPCTGRRSTASIGGKKASISITSTLAASDQLKLSKSTFQAFAVGLPLSSSVHSSDRSNTPIPPLMRTVVVPTILAHLNDLNPRTQRASHAMYAWRTCRCPLAIKQTTDFTGGQMMYGSSNGGEPGAGERLEKLLELGKCEDVVIVVFRWYGGVKLGSDRWKCISSVAKEALERGGFMPGPKTSSAYAGRSPPQSQPNSPKRQR